MTNTDPTDRKSVNTDQDPEAAQAVLSTEAWVGVRLSPANPAASVNECVTVSIVSHGNGWMAEQLVNQLLAQAPVAKIVLTLNIEEALNLPATDRLEIIRNSRPKGFGANHNAAFRHCQTEFFCVLNPDVVLTQPIFEGLITEMRHAGAVLAAPAAVSLSGVPADSWRQFPTFGNLFLKAIGRDPSVILPDPKVDTMFPAWVGGMCQLFESAAYQELNGFDEGYFLYYEDVDICARVWQAGYRLVACPKIVVTHGAQRASRHNCRHIRWHAMSMVRYFRKFLGKLPATHA